jgi:hypothetical protein
MEVVKMLRLFDDFGEDLSLVSRAAVLKAIVEYMKQSTEGAAMPHPLGSGRVEAKTNGEELGYGFTFAANFHKGLPHDVNGFVSTTAYVEYVDALLHQDHRRFEDLPVGDNVPANDPRYTVGNEGRRKLTSPFTGYVFDTEGADAGALAMEAAPTLGSDEFAAELAEIYVMALLRDKSFEDIRTGADPLIIDMAAELAAMPWFMDAASDEPIGSRRRRLKVPHDLFRGSTKGSQTGPWLSQFMLVGNKIPNLPIPPLRDGTKPICDQVAIEVKDGWVFYGTQFIDQRTVAGKAGVDWLQTWASWLDAQNGVDFGLKDELQPERRFLTTPRDIATYVHFDALYQAYHVACNLMLAVGAPFSKDRGLPETLSRTRSGFATFGGPHVLALLAEVSSRALKSVWRQKWLHHRRLRPEVAAALLTLHVNKPNAIPDVGGLRLALTDLRNKIPPMILEAIMCMNSISHAKKRIESNPDNTGKLPDIKDGTNYLLPMAFPEGSPTHPAYGAGHATVAGACVTVLKAFFEMYDDNGDELPWPILSPGGSKYGFGDIYVGDGLTLKEWTGTDKLTVQGELDKLAGNISIARNMAGVHYYTDYFASIRLGERITVSILEEQAALYNEDMSMSFTSFDGDRIRVRGHHQMASVSVINRNGDPISASDWYYRYGGKPY